MGPFAASFSSPCGRLGQETPEWPRLWHPTPLNLFQTSPEISPPSEPWTFGADALQRGSNSGCFQCVVILQFLTIASLAACLLTSLVAPMVKCLPAMQETWIQSLGWEDPLEKEMATHSSALAWKIPWPEESGRLQSMGSQSRT